MTLYTHTLTLSKHSAVLYCSYTVDAPYCLVYTPEAPLQKRSTCARTAPPGCEFSRPTRADRADTPARFGRHVGGPLSKTCLPYTASDGVRRNAKTTASAMRQNKSHVSSSGWQSGHLCFLAAWVARMRLTTHSSRRRQHCGRVAYALELFEWVLSRGHQTTGSIRSMAPKSKMGIAKHGNRGYSSDVELQASQHQACLASTCQKMLSNARSNACCAKNERTGATSIKCTVVTVALSMNKERDKTKSHTK